jgi:hypothetical protein
MNNVNPQRNGATIPMAQGVIHRGWRDGFIRVLGFALLGPGVKKAEEIAVKAAKEVGKSVEDFLREAERASRP